MLYAFDKRYGTCKFVWYSVVHTPVEDIEYSTLNFLNLVRPRREGISEATPFSSVKMGRQTPPPPPPPHTRSAQGMPLSTNQ
jgi:hypothetical protein